MIRKRYQLDRSLKLSWTICQIMIQQNSDENRLSSKLSKKFLMEQWA